MAGDASHTGEIDSVTTKQVFDPVAGFIRTERAEKGGLPSKSPEANRLIEGVSAGESFASLRKKIQGGNTETSGFFHKEILRYLR